MSHIKTYIFSVWIILVALNISRVQAQSKNNSLKELFRRAKLELASTPWVIGLGGNVIDDDGKPFENFFDVKNGWNVAPFPTKVSCEKLMLHGWSSEFAFTYNYIKNGKIINGDVRTYTGNYMAFDLSAKYNFNEFFKTKSWLDLYMMHGFGFTHRDAVKYQNVATSNLAFGASAWIYEDMLGINVQTMAKFGLSAPLFKTGSNYLQHSLSIVYKFSSVAGSNGTRAKYKFFKNRKPLGKIDN